MKKLIVFSSFLILIIIGCKQSGEQLSNSDTRKKFNFEKDLLLLQVDCKTDVDDIHTAAAFATLLANEKFAGIKYHVVAGSYGIQEGLYVPANDLFELAFGDNWSDAHNKRNNAVERVTSLIKETILIDGDVWIADAGQSDFSADVIRKVKMELPDIDLQNRIHIVQHSDWNEKVTSPEKLKFVKENIDYIKINDGNFVGNGTPGFNSADFKNWKEKLNNQRLISIWQKAVDIGNKYNGKEGRYLNKSIEAGGLDFSDLSEVCRILGEVYIVDVKEFFDLYGK